MMQTGSQEVHDDQGKSILLEELYKHFPDYSFRGRLIKEKSSN